jgi:hypothetical protein
MAMDHAQEYPSRSFCLDLVLRTHRKEGAAEKMGATSSREGFYLAMSTILALEALVLTDSTPFMQPSFDS